MRESSTFSTKSAFVALLGKPNVGKSSLLNALVGEKLAIVTPKPQTTRTRVTGVCTNNGTQLIFTDTPGVHRPKTKLGDKMLDTVRKTVVDMDIAVMVIEPTQSLNSSEQQLVKNLTNRRALAVINKLDTLKDRSELLPIMNMLKECSVFSEIVPLSAKTGEGVDNLMKLLVEMAPLGPYFFPEDTLTEQPEKVICAELVREKLLLCLSDEIPHGTAVVVERMNERTDKPIVDIDVTIYCERDSHKGIIIGRNGTMLKRIATMARLEMENFLQTKINLGCRVKVSHSWRNEERLVRKLVVD